MALPFLPDKKRKAVREYSIPSSGIIDLTLSDSENEEPQAKRTKSTTPSIENNDIQKLAKISQNVSHPPGHVIESRPTPPLPLPADTGSGRVQSIEISSKRGQFSSSFKNTPRWASANNFLRDLERIGLKRSSSSSPLVNSSHGVGRAGPKITQDSEVIALSISDSDEPASRSGASFDSQEVRNFSPELHPPESPLANDGSLSKAAKPPQKRSQFPAPILSQKVVVEIPKYRPKLLNDFAVRPSKSGERRNKRTSGKDDLLAQFTASVSSPARENAERKAFLKELEELTGPIRPKLLESVHRLFGSTGFSEVYGTAEETKKLKRIAQKKARNIKRKEVQLDFGEPSAPNAVEMVSLIHPRDLARNILGSKFTDTFDTLLTFSNEVNMRQLGGKFQFISKNILRDQVVSANQASNYGCECAGYCHPATCRCLEKEIEVGKDGSEKPIMRNKMIQTYARRPDGLVVLTDSYLDHYSKRSEITECNDLCGCDNTCVNRVVQKGRTIPLEIFLTDKCGFGVRSSTKIARGQFIELYLGEVILQSALQHREEIKAADMSSYVFSLDWWTLPPQEPYHIDGENFGSAMRFVNHCCEPNARSFPTQLEHHGDKRIYSLAFFAIKEIGAGEEITIDYNPQLAALPNEKLRDLDFDSDNENNERQAGENEVIDEEEDEVLDEDTVLCRCGARNCRIRLWPKAGTPRKRRRRLREKV